MMMIQKGFFKDVRGFVHVLEFKGVEHLFVYTKARFMRGGEIHRGKQFCTLLQGKMKWIQPDSETIISAPACFIVPKGVPHMMEAITDCLFLEWREFPIEKPVNYYEPYRSLIRERMKK